MSESVVGGVGDMQKLGKEGGMDVAVARETVANEERVLPTHKPLLRWAGGKQQMVGVLLAHSPADVKRRRYVEPFLGAASLFLAIKPARALLSDANQHLIEFYERVRDRPLEIARNLQRIASRHSPENYYLIREEFNSSRSSLKKSAQFLYLNRTSFNGIYRVNKSGHYNVPFGNKPRPWFPDVEDLAHFALALRDTSLECLDYREALRRARKGDFVYLDPPYVPLSDTAYFAHYTADRFVASDQLELARIVRVLDRRGCLVMMTNSDTSAVRLMYKDFRITPVDVRRYVTCKQRHAVQELIIRNY